MPFFGPWADELCAHLQNPLLKTLKTIHDKKFVDQPWPFGSWSNKCPTHLYKKIMRKKNLSLEYQNLTNYMFSNSWSNKLVAMLTYLDFILGPPILSGHQNKSIES
jgi:hypothetical protein